MNEGAWTSPMTPLGNDKLSENRVRRGVSLRFAGAASQAEYVAGGD
jgi:hypothetical protein